ncbi:MAG: flagellin [Arsenophonus endosymbiont of Dermacentor nuttalli]
MTATIDNLVNTTNHLQAVRSRIQDAYFSCKLKNLTNRQILQQMATSVFKPDNKSAQTVVTLLP